MTDKAKAARVPRPGTFLRDRDGRLWVMEIHPGQAGQHAGDRYLRLHGQETPLWHTYDHVRAEFGPLHREPKPDAV